jgi:endonuclease/exonuclease/phosphatase family metal-dependent hydrolase
MMMIRSTLTLGLILSLLGAVGAHPSKKEGIRVMTQNQFLGADLAPILQAIGTPHQDAILTATLAQMAANNFPLRARALAEQICEAQPHVVGMQEVFRFSLDGCPDSDNPFCPAALPLPFVDHLTELMAAIHKRCHNYIVAASVQHSDFGQKVQDFGTIRFTDRDVILTRADVRLLPSAPLCPVPAASGVTGVAASGCHYTTLLPLPPSIGGAVLRGYVGVDVKVQGVRYRVVTTHLEVMFPDPTNLLSMGIQAAQATELLQVLAFQQPPGTRTIVVGDFNSSPDDAAAWASGELPIVPPYTQFTTGITLSVPVVPYTDVWDMRPGHQPGFTCCHDEDLSIRKAPHKERIDMIFSLEVPDKVQASVLGDQPSDRIRGLWPSDHCSVEAGLRF